MDTRERILQTSMTLFIKYGIRSITMDRIAEELGISKRTIYELFHDKDDLLLQAIRNFAGEKKKESAKMIRESDNVIEIIFKFAAAQSGQMREINPQFVHDLRKHHPKVFRILSDRNDLRDYSLTRNFLESGIKQGIFTGTMDIDLVNHFLHLLLNLFGPEADPRIQKFAHRDIFNNIFLAYIRGISTEKGIQLIDQYKSNIAFQF